MYVRVRRKGRKRKITLPKDRLPVEQFITMSPWKAICHVNCRAREKKDNSA